MLCSQDPEDKHVHNTRTLEAQNLSDDPAAIAADVFPYAERPPDAELVDDKYGTHTEIVGNGVAHPTLHLPSQQLMLQDSSGEDYEVKLPKKRAETWVHEEIRSLIAFRAEFDTLFNTTKSNKHLWEQISIKMREIGFDRSAAMCTDKWRNLLKEYRKAKRQDKGSSKMLCFKDLDELLRLRTKGTTCKSPGKLEPYRHYSPKGAHKPMLNVECRLSQEGQSLALPSDDPVIDHHWGWRETIEHGGDHAQLSYGGRVIIIKYGDMVRKLGIDGSFEAIKETIKAAFGLRTKRAFWLEDEYGIVRTLDRKMAEGSYNLHVDEGLTIKLCLHDDDSGHLVEERTFYTEEDFYDFLQRRGWVSLQEVDGLRDVDSLEELRSMCIYQRVLHV